MLLQNFNEVGDEQGRFIKILASFSLCVLTLGAASCANDSGSSIFTTSHGTPSDDNNANPPRTPTSGPCLVSPLQTEGPYYINANLNRSNIQENQQGIPLHLNITVIDAITCKPLSGVRVDVWQANALGIYSGIAAEGTSGQTFLRGNQVTDSQGRVNFQTVYPGWYPGRAVHIHWKVHMTSGVVDTSQMYFDDRISDQVFATSPYNTHAGGRTLNADDMIEQSDRDQLLLTEAVFDGTTVTANIRIVVSNEQN